MSEPKTSPPNVAASPVDDLEFSGEEDVGGLGTPTKDLGSAIVIAAVAAAAMVMSLRLDVPGSIFTAPGLLPFLTSLSLFLMALSLAANSLRAGAGKNFAASTRKAAAAYFNGIEDRRALLLVSIVVAYVVLVGSINFNLRLPTPLFVFQVSSYEIVSIVVVTLILRLFWQAPTGRCFLVSVATIEVLATIFRYGFGILMPESF
jgi:hypothetical protein